MSVLRVAANGDVVKMEYVLSDYEPHILTLTLHSGADFSFFNKDTRLEIMRSPAEGYASYLEADTQFFVRKIKAETDSKGVTLYNIICESAKGLVRRRIIPYASQNTYTQKSTYADDMMKAIMRENFGALAIDSNRDISAWLEIAPDVSAGLAMTKEFSRRNVYDVLREIAETSRQLGQYLTYDIVRVSQNLLRFQTYVNCRGTDRRDMAIFSLTRRNLIDSVYEEDAFGEKTYIYCGGLGVGEERVVATAADAARIAASPFGRMEDFVDGRQTEDITALTNDASQALWSSRPRQSFSGTIAETENSIYGIDYFFGDIVTAFGYGKSFPCLVDRVHVTVDANEIENLDINIRSDQVV